MTRRALFKLLIGSVIALIVRPFRSWTNQELIDLHANRRNYHDARTLHYDFLCPLTKEQEGALIQRAMVRLNEIRQALS